MSPTYHSFHLLRIYILLLSHNTSAANLFAPISPFQTKFQIQHFFGYVNLYSFHRVPFFLSNFFNEKISKQESYISSACFSILSALCAEQLSVYYTFFLDILSKPIYRATFSSAPKPSRCHFLALPARVNSSLHIIYTMQFFARCKVDTTMI